MNFLKEKFTKINFFNFEKIKKYQITLLIIFFVFINAFFYNEIRIIERDFNDSKNPLDYSTASGSIDYKELFNENLQDKISLLNKSFPDSQIQLLHISNGVNFYPHFDWNLNNFSMFYNNKFSFQMVNTNFLGSLIKENKSNTGLILIEGNLPSKLNEIIVDIRFKELGYKLNDSLAFGHYIQGEISFFDLLFNNEFSQLNNITLKISGFYEIENDILLKSIIDYDFRIKLEDATDIHIKNQFFYFYYYIFGNIDLGENLISNYEDNYSSDKIPYISKIIITKNSNKQTSISQILSDAKKIEQKIEEINKDNYKFWNFNDLEENSNELIHIYSDYSNYNLKDIYLGYGNYYYIKYCIESIKNLYSEIFLLSIPVLIAYGLFIFLNSKRIVEDNEDAIVYLHLKGKEIDFVKNKLYLPVMKINLILFVLYFISIFFLEIISIGRILFQISIKFHILMNFSTFLINILISRLIFSKEISKIINALFPEFQTDFYLLEDKISRSLKKKKRRQLFQLIYSILPILLIYFYNSSFVNKIGIHYLFDDLFLLIIIFLSIGSLFILPNIASNLIFPLLVKQYKFIFSKILKKKKNSRLNFFIKIIKNKPIILKKYCVILMIISSYSFFGSFFYSYQRNLEVKENELTWDKFDISIAVKETETIHNEMINYILNNFDISEDLLEIHDKIIYLRGTNDNSFQSFWSKNIESNLYIDSINLDNIHFESIDNNIHNYSAVFNLLSQNNENIIISNAYAKSMEIEVNDTLEIYSDLSENQSMKLFKVIGIIDFSPLLNIDRTPNQIFFIFENSPDDIVSTTHIYLKMNRQFDLDFFRKEIYLKYSNIIESIQFLENFTNENPAFLEKFFFSEIILLYIIQFFLLIFNFNKIFEFRKKEKKLLFLKGLSKREFNNIIKIEILIYLFLIVVFAFLINLILSKIFYDLLSLLTWMKFEFSFYGGLKTFFFYLSWERNWDLNFFGRYIQVPYNIFLTSLIHPIFYFLLYQIYIKIKLKSEFW